MGFDITVRSKEFLYKNGKFKSKKVLGILFQGLCSSFKTKGKHKKDFCSRC